MIKISVPNDDSVALFHFGKSLIDMSSTIEGSPGWVVITQEEYDSLKGEQQTEKDAEWLEQRMKEALLETLTKPKNEKIPHNDKFPEMFRQSASRAIEKVMENSPIFARDVEPDTTAKQVESLATHIITSEEKVGDPVYVGDGNFSQGYRIEVEELVTTDSTDTPWDERIHSASKALNADGTWRLRRKPKDMNEDEWELEIQGVRDELSGKKNEDALQSPLYEVSPGHIGVMQPEPPVTPPGDDFHVDAGVVTEQQVADIPPPPPVPVPPVPEFDAQERLDWMAKTPALTETEGQELKARVNNTPMTFPQVMAYLTERHGRISNAQVEQIITEMGLKSIMDLNTQAEHTGPFIARVKALLGE